MGDLLKKIGEIIETILEDPLLIILTITIILFVTRELRCWYWRINERIALHHQEIDSLHKLIDLQKEQIRLLESNISKMNQLIYNTAAIEEAAPTKEEALENKSPE